MGLEVLATAGALAGTGGYSAYEQRKARKQAEAAANEERARLEELRNQPPARLPTETDAKNARRRSIRSLLARKGRSSTILTGEGSDALGG